MSGEGYLQPMSIQGYLQPMSGEGYLQPMKGQGYLQPMSGERYLQPMSGEGYLQPMSGQGYLQPMSSQCYLQPIKGQESATSSGADGFVEAPVCRTKDIRIRKWFTCILCWWFYPRAHDQGTSAPPLPDVWKARGRILLTPKHVSSVPQEGVLVQANPLVQT
ncbi:hypothetical protein NHX12_024219 [Muraenolepis orangiensis]|uniref:Uncharacterized protein n=1 Tax=Muraenolepis orangiensis TaxID=630683 RepID=A0A9Q0EQE0_9TELE|nr:hypothetical protein NHX12_024219 [Muraenolepis orangiensis]